ncbi:MAG TPA: DMT family transporter [Sunxiuqinia sp.]|nr:DMT family transporter [Sunxiuqinia sp.]
MKSQKAAIGWALLAVLLWSTVASAFKLALLGLNPFQLIFVASIVSLLTFLLIILFQGKFSLLIKMNQRQLLLSAGQGLFNPFLYYLVLFKAYDLNPAQVTQSLNMIWPITLALLSAPMLGHKIGWRNLWGILLSFLGVVFIASQGSVEGFYNTNLFGALLALGSSVIWSLYWLFSVKDERDKLIVFFWNFLFGIVYLFLFGLIDPSPNFPIHLDRSFLVAVYVGLFELGITYVVWMKALQTSENNAVTGNFIFLMPFLSLIFIHFILKEVIYMTTFLGLVFILLGIFVQQFKRKPKF